jgi:hypothetical protein
VFTHHLVGGVYSPAGQVITPYGRGGAEAVKHLLDNRGSYEWGGEDEWGSYEFDSERPGWSYGPIHDLLVGQNVTAVFHGHDHVFVYQVVDGIVYQACPQPSDADYGDGFYEDGCYALGTRRDNSGHLRVTVEPDYVQVDYVRAVLPGDEPLMDGGVPVYNGQVSYSYSLGTARVEGESPEPRGLRLLGNRPNPFRSETSVMLALPATQFVSVRVIDVEGREVQRLFRGTLEAGTHEIPWQGVTSGLNPAAPGIYMCEVKAGASTTTGKILLLR